MLAEGRDPVFFAVVMSALASVLFQLPRFYLPIGRLAIRKFDRKLRVL
jgi:hypothetical protein